MPTTGGSAKGKKPAAQPAKAAKSGKGNPAPLSDPNVNSFYPYHFSGSAQTALPFDGFGNPWNGSYVTATGNLKMDLLHNFFLECGARAGKARVYEMTADPTARAMVGYLLVRGGVHIVAYAKALEKLTGADVGRLLPIPSVSNKQFPEAAKLEAEGLHTIMWRWSPERSLHPARRNLERSPSRGRRGTGSARRNAAGFSMAGFSGRAAALRSRRHRPGDAEILR